MRLDDYIDGALKKPESGNVREEIGTTMKPKHYRADEARRGGAGDERYIAIPKTKQKWMITRAKEMGDFVKSIMETDDKALVEEYLYAIEMWIRDLRGMLSKVK